ncbi:TetR/AcrR family transcriptional regulator [Rhodovulum adriaticum]|uniref:TetR family transcriptional regulator n=1 Tax=Rhodovulum adriaticum TaxID=35804 RepID=A0A4R2NZH6_RHOAD|nr:TetR/AcrR family transcriptional regulator [Rhodovulum adriaticum]MBK1634822.1 hypothetical protein [Rhodovulum adriaticum]TCP27602.1 TetR family transcriptional regulator [Rhodovulum adriaticum]
MTARKSADLRRADIVEAVLDLLASVSPERLSTSRIAAKVGVSHGALFRHFPTKDDIWRSVMEEVEHRAQRAWAKASEIGGGPRDRLRMLCLAQLGLIEQTPAIPALVMAPGRHVAEDSVRPIVLRLMAGLMDRMVALARQAKAAGNLRGDLQPDDIAALLLGILQGLVLRWSLSGRGFDLVTEGDRLVCLQLRLMAPSQPQEVSCD